MPLQIYVAIANKKAGPFTLFQVEERLRRGELTEDSLGWYEGVDEWKPLEELPPFESFFRLRDVERENERRRKEAENVAAFEKRQAEALPKTAVRPWTRFCARHLDFFFFLTACLVIYSGLRSAGWIEADMARFIDFFPIFVPIFVPIWHLLEAYFINQWGSTPGKALVGIHITDSEGNRLTTGASIRRSLGVYVLGLGCYLFPISIVASLFGYYFLKKNRRSFWDVSAESYVHHAPLQARHVLWPVALIFLLFTIFQGPFAELAAFHAEQMDRIRESMGGNSDSTL